MIKGFRLFESHEDIHDICKKYFLEGYTVNYDNSIDTDFSVNLSEEKLEKLPLKFRNVFRNFECGNNQLKSLDGCPEFIGRGFYCEQNQLTSLKGGPKTVNGDYACSHNQLTSLEGSPTNIGGSFNCHNNQLTSLEGGPKVISGGFNCINNKIYSLKGCPESIGGMFLCYYNPISVLVNAWININPNRHSMIEYFNDLDIVQGKNVIIDRLEEFMDIYNIKINLNEVKKYYVVI